MDSAVPEQTPFEAINAQTSRFTRYATLSGRMWMTLLTFFILRSNTKSTWTKPHHTYRWMGTGLLLLLFFARILYAQGWYIGALSQHSTGNPPFQFDLRDTADIGLFLQSRTRSVYTY